MPLFSGLLFLTSCSWLERMERNLVGAEENQKQASGARRQSVPKAQYDELLSRYEELNKQYQSLKEGRAADPLVTELKQAPLITNQGVDNTPRVETVMLSLVRKLLLQSPQRRRLRPVKSLLVMWKAS